MNYTKKQLEQMIEQQKNSMFAERKFYLDKIAKLEEEILYLKDTIDSLENKEV